jgi:hypothetical protein
LHVISEHRHQVPLSIHNGHDQRQREGPPRFRPLTSNVMK